MSENTTSETVAPEAEGTAPRKRGWRPRRLHWHLSIWSLVSAALIAVFILLASMSATGRVIVLPNWVTEKVVARLNTVSPPLRFTLKHVEFGMLPSGLPRLRLVDLGIRDATGLDLAQLNGVEGGFRIGAALVGRIEPTMLRLQGAQMTLRRLTDGSIALSLGQQAGTAGSLASMLDSIDAVFTDGPLATVSRVEASDLTITLEDARSGRIWQVTDGHMVIKPTENLVDTTVSFDVFNQTEELASTELSFRSAKGSSEASLAARFENAAARDIAAQSPALAFLSVIDAPISGALRSSINADGQISDLAGTMRIGSGALSPTPGAQPAKFDGAQIYIDFDPVAQRIDFQGASVRSELGTVDAEGHVYLADFNGAWPNSLIGQITLNNAVLNPGDMFAAPLTIDRGQSDLRVQLNPFSIDIGQAVIFRGDHRYEGSGTISAGSDGWRIAIDGAFDTAERDELLALWPLIVEPNGRNWVAERVLGGVAHDGALAWRKEPGSPLILTGTFGVENARLRPMDTLPEIIVENGYVTMAPQSFAAIIEDGTVTAPDGSVMDASGSGYMIPDITVPKKTGIVELAVAGPVRGTLSLLDLEPFSVFRGNNLGPDMARGSMVAGGRISFPIPMRPNEPIPVEAFDYDIEGTMTNVTSDVLIANKLLVADRLSLSARDEGIEISGPVRIGQAEGIGSWVLPLNDGKAGEAHVDGTVMIDQASLSEFGLGSVEGMVSGAARGSVSLELPNGAAPKLHLVSDLAGLAMSIPGTGWSKPASTTASLELDAVLGDRPEIGNVSIDAPGLTANGRVTTAEGGGLGEARFERVRIGGWLDAPVVLTGRGNDVPIGISIPGGTIDMRRATFDANSSGGGRSGPRQPLTLAVDKMIVSEGITIQNLRGDFDLSGGLHGTFNGHVAGGANISGSVAQQKAGSAFRITSDHAGGVLKGAGVFTTARGGTLELVLAPLAAAGTYEGEFTIKNTRLVDAPAMAEMLSAVSVVGLIEQLNHEGILFSTVEGRFKLEPNAVTLYHSSAVGASMGVSLDGYYDMKNGQLDMQGVLSPFYILNSFGRIISARDGEGLVGFNFTLTGKTDDPDVGINPLSILMPGVLREIFRRPAPEEVPKE